MGALLSTSKKESLERQFAQIDKNGDGLISKIEMQNFLRREDFLFPEDQIRLFFYWADENSDGYLNFYEFLNSVKKSHLKENAKIFARNLFREYDLDKDGYISFNELKQINATFHSISLSEDDLRENFRAIDKNNDKKLSLGEFTVYFKDISHYIK